MDVVRALSPFLGSVIAGGVLGYRYPRLDWALLLLPGIALAIPAWIAFGWLGIGTDADLDRSGRIFVWLALLLLLLALWAGGTLLGKWVRGRVGRQPAP
jgi:hypothetical protein